jgi:hypothetical protein
MNRTSKIALALVLWLTFVISACEPPPAGLEIEDTYSDAGPFSTTSKSVDGFKIFYPKNLEGDHPIITWGNGTGAPTMVYSPFLKHLASWGFVVIASNSVMAQDGNDLVAGIDYLIDQNETAHSEFSGMLDTDHIGTTGHSQGGGGAINAATDSRVTCSAPIAPSPAKIGRVKGSMFLVAGTADTIVSQALVRFTSFDWASCPTVFGIADGMGHLAFVGNAGGARGYITAWFMYHLQGDEYAGEAFSGDCEICSNRNWSVEMKNFF